MKKFFAFFFAILLCVCLVACEGNKNKPAKETEPVESTTEAVSETEAPVSETETPIEESSEEPVETSEPTAEPDTTIDPDIPVG